MTNRAWTNLDSGDSSMHDCASIRGEPAAQVTRYLFYTSTSGQPLNGSTIVASRLVAKELREPAGAHQHGTQPSFDLFHAHLKLPWTLPQSARRGFATCAPNLFQGSRPKRAATNLRSFTYSRIRPVRCRSTLTSTVSPGSETILLPSPVSVRSR
jgi:hypothetical protein